MEERGIWRNGRRKATAGHGKGGRKEGKKTMHQHFCLASVSSLQSAYYSFFTVFDGIVNTVGYLGIVDNSGVLLHCKCFGPIIPGERYAF
jgi:hypothetical protein